MKAAGMARVDFADGYCSHIALNGVTAIQCARAMFENPPRFVTALMSLRNAIVAPFGLHRPSSHSRNIHGGKSVGIFPLVFESDDEVVFGLDDTHLNFRIWVSVRPDHTGCSITVSTLVGLNNILGKIYLFCVMPFHRMLSRHLFQRALQHLEATGASLTQTSTDRPAGDRQ